MATGATWHHFVNINIKQYYVSLAEWLMPKNVPRCLRFSWALSAISTTELFEELPGVPLEKPELKSVEQISISVRKTLRSHHPKAQVTALIHDNLEQALGEKAFARVGVKGVLMPSKCWLKRSVRSSKSERSH